MKKWRIKLNTTDVCTVWKSKNSRALITQNKEDNGKRKKRRTNKTRQAMHSLPKTIQNENTSLPSPSEFEPSPAPLTFLRSTAPSKAFCSFLLLSFPSLKYPRRIALLLPPNDTKIKAKNGPTLPHVWTLRHPMRFKYSTNHEAALTPEVKRETIFSVSLSLF